MRLTHAADAVIVTATTMIAAASNLLLTDDPDSVAEMKILLLPLLGAVMTSGGMIMLNPSPETRRIVIGRAIFSLFIGTLGPSLISAIHPALENLAVKPAVLLGLGGGLAMLAYALSKPFTRELYERSERVARYEADRLENTYAPGPKDPPAPR